MKEILRKKLHGKKGFTLAELLIVVAIIGVLVAIAIPVFGGAVAKAHHAADLSAVRATYAEKVIGYMTGPSYSGATGTVTIELDDLKAVTTTAAGGYGSTVAHTDGKIVVTLNTTYTGEFPVDDNVTINP